MVKNQQKYKKNKQKIKWEVGQNRNIFNFNSDLKVKEQSQGT